VPVAAEVLVFSRTAGYRHESIPAGVAALTEVARTRGLTVTATEDAAAFTGSELRRYLAVVFLNTSGDVFDDDQRDAFEAYVHGGGGFLGVHCAAATEPAWPFYRSLVAADFRRHPEVQPATLRVEDHDHLATRHLGRTWGRTDEWYDFEVSPRERVRVLLSLEESSYRGGGMAGDHPIAWCHSHFGGRSFYTALGHTVASYRERLFREHLRGALAWVAAG
jgi:type 1 glutamine amidotransferase